MPALPDVPPADALTAALAATAAGWADPEHPARTYAAAETLAVHPDYTAESVTFAVNQAMHALTAEALAAWADGRRAAAPRTVAVLHAGNVPLGELQDALAVLLAGHRYVGVVSSRSPHLLPAFLADVAERLPGLPVAFAPFEEALARADALVATGSDETREAVAAAADAAGIPPARRLLRGHRVGVAVLDGRETADERERLAEDVLLHEGAGCRNVAVVFAPAGLDADPVFEAFALARGVYPAPPTTAARLKMPAAFLRATTQPHASLSDGSLLVSRGAPEPQAPGHLRWTEATLGEAAAWIAEHEALVQVVAAREGLHARLRAALPPDLAARLVPLGDTQRPPLDWHPDGVDTLGWLCGV